MNWTDEQRKTIETTGRSILVSAAAGSGKTTVLVERIKNLLINEGADIDRFLITTFTNAAAAEMKERLDKALREEMKKPDADKAALARQLAKLPSASIGTFHSFAFQLIRQYFYLIDIEPGFGVADEIQVEIMKRNAVDNVFRARYEENTEKFRNFILKYAAGRNDQKIRDNILETCRTIASIHHGLEWAYAKAANLASDDPLRDIGGYRFFARKIMEGLAEAHRRYGRSAELANINGLALCYGAAAEDVENLEEVIQQAQVAFACLDEELRKRIEAFWDVLSTFKAGSMSYKKDEADEEIQKRIKKEREAGKNALDGVKKTVYSRSFDELNEELKGIHEDTVYYIGLIEDYLKELGSMKAAENIIEFDDALHYAIDILEHEEAAEELREKYEYIFVDEYQDSNYLQEEIVGKIARDDNLFMVGDIKQCIYKFRLSEPEIFRGRAIDYADEETSGLLLNISSNFRSKMRVTEPVNKIFRELMPGYDAAAELHCTAGDEHRGFPPRVHLIVNGEFDEDAPEKNDAEGAVIAGIIRERLGTEIYDGKQGRMRPLTLGDFAVIVRNNKEAEDIERYLINEGIAAYGESGGKFFETVEVQVFINLLRIIDNMRQDVPLISAMRSVVFGFTVKELAKIRIAFRDKSYSSAVLQYAEEGPEDELREKIRNMIHTVDIWKEISRTVPLEDLIKEILYGTGYYDYCSGLPVGTQRISNLRLIADKASRFEEMSHSGLYGFLKYVESMESSDKTDSEAKTISEGENVVRVMSVHKSKGLEFPVVIFANASKGTKGADKGGQIKVHREHGIGLPIVNREQHWHRTSILQKMIADTAADEKVEEEIRILYVALTRAKDGLEIVGTIKEMEKLEDGLSTKTFLEMMYEPLTKWEETKVLIYDNADDLAQSHSRRMHTPQELYAKAGQFHNEDLMELVDARLSYEYPYTSGAQIKPKYSVSEINREAAGHGAAGDAAGAASVTGAAVEMPILEITAFDPDAVKAAGKTGGPISAARRGTIMHLLMEKADFGKACEQGNSGADGMSASEYLQTVADRLLADDVITAEEYDTISIDKAAAFFDAEPGKRAAEASRLGKLRKEQEFILNLEMAEGEETIVQGIIDCFFEEEDGLALIDFKNSYVGAGRTEKDIAESYRSQIELYRQALEGATGKTVKEAYLFLFDTGQFVAM